MIKNPPKADATAGPRPPVASAVAEWITLTSGSGVAATPRPLRTRTIFAQILAGAVIVLVAVAVLGAIASRRVAEREAVTDAAKTTDLLAEKVVEPVLGNGVITGDVLALASLDQVIRNDVLNRSIVRVKIWSPAGTIVYSDEKRIIGRTFSLGAAELDVLAHPQTRAAISNLGEPENAYEQGRGPLLEVYRPVRTPDGHELLFETYSLYSAVTDRSGQLWRGFAGITLSSLLLLVVLLLPVLWRLLDRLKAAQVQREALLQRAVDASSEERRRIAGRLHDGAVQELAATSFAVAGAADRADALGQTQLADSLRDAAGTVRASIRGLRSLLVDIYPPSLESAGLEAALGDLAAVLRARHVEVTLDVDPRAVEALGHSGERLVFRVVQECLRNVERHAGASAIRVNIHWADTRVVLEVIDNGVGFDAALTLADPEDGHFGLRVLVDVAAERGARLDVKSAPGAGTHWRLEVPDVRGCPLNAGL